VMLSPKLERDALEQARDDEEEGVRVMSAETALKLQTAMLAVVDRGTGAAAQPFFAGTGWDLGGKTGTAQIPGRPDDGWFSGLVFDPEGRARYSVVVYLQGGGPGGRMPASIGGGMTRALVEHQQAAAEAQG
jgi:cell division protein FtsI/penicillin-binding protein 2